MDYSKSDVAGLFRITQTKNLQEIWSVANVNINSYFVFILEFFALFLVDEVQFPVW